MKYQNFQEFKVVVHTPKKSKMQGDKFYSIERNISVRMTWFLYKFLPFLKPNHVTLISFLILLLVFILNFVKFNQYFIHITILQLLALYFITILDKIDGELARAHQYFTQKGVYYDYTVHFFYPFIFYFTVGYYFFVITGTDILFYITLLLSVITTYLIMFRQTAMFVTKIVTESNHEIKDFIYNKKEKRRLPFIFRLFDYLTFMIYAWTLFFYLVLIIISIYSFYLAFLLYLVHVFYSLIVVSYRVFWSYPRRNLMRKI